MAPPKKVVQPFSLYSTVPLPPALISSTSHSSLNLQILFPGEPLPLFDPSNLAASLAPLFQPRAIASVFNDRKFPVIIFLVGGLCQPNMYLWLLLALLNEGVVCVIPSTLVSLMNNLSPSCFPTLPEAQTLEDYHAGPGTPSLKAILAELERLNETGVLKGRLDLERVALGGHSLGGIIALESGNKSNLPGLRGVFTYGTMGLAHGKGRPFCPSGAILPFYRADGSVPTLIIGGTNELPLLGNTKGVEKTFKEGFGGGGAEVYMASIAGASHMTVCHPNSDPTILANLVLLPATCDEDAARDLILELVAKFLQAHLIEDDSSKVAAASRKRLVELTDPLRSKALAGGGYRASTLKVKAADIGDKKCSAIREQHSNDVLWGLYHSDRTC